MTLRVEGLRLRARNEGHESHYVWLSAQGGKSQRSQQRILAPGEEMTLDLPNAEVPVAAYDLTDHVKLILSGPLD